jgi:hypothetical protein
VRSLPCGAQGKQGGGQIGAEERERRGSRPGQYLQYCKISSGQKHFPPKNKRKNLIHFILNWLRMGDKEK